MIKIYSLNITKKTHESFEKSLWQVLKYSEKYKSKKQEYGPKLHKNISEDK